MIIDKNNHQIKLLKLVISNKNGKVKIFTPELDDDPLLERNADTGPTEEQRRRIRAARQRIAEHRAARGRAQPVAQAVFILAVVMWCILVVLSPWRILGSTAAATLVVGLATVWRNRRRKKRHRR